MKMIGTNLNLSLSLVVCCFLVANLHDLMSQDSLVSAGPSIKFGSHEFSLKKPKSFRPSKSRGVGNSSLKDLENKLLSSNSVRNGKNVDSDLEKYTKQMGVEIDRTDDNELDCSQEFTKTIQLLSQLHSKHTSQVVQGVDDYLTRHISRCENILSKNVMVAVDKIEDDGTGELDVLREKIEDAADETGFPSDDLDKHVPAKNLALAVTWIMSDRNQMKDPRKSEQEFLDNFIRVYEEVCKPIHEGLRELMHQYDALASLLHLRDDSAEENVMLKKWMSNTRMCSHEDVLGLAKDAAQSLLEQLGDMPLDESEEGDTSDSEVDDSI